MSKIQKESMSEKHSKLAASEPNACTEKANNILVYRINNHNIIESEFSFIIEFLRKSDLYNVKY